MAKTSVSKEGSVGMQLSCVIKWSSVDFSVTTAENTVS